MLTGTNLKYTKAFNFRIVLETIRLHGPLSRADIARHTELSPQTVSNLTRELIEANLVEETHRRSQGRGAPATILNVNAEGAFSIGLDLDRDHLTGMLVDFSGAVRHREHYELDFPSSDEALDLMETTAQRLVEHQGLTTDRIWGIGVGLPGPLEISEESVVNNMVNPKAFPGWKNVPVVDILTNRLSLPIYLENNATAAAVGERWYGAGQHIDTFFYVFFGAGLGGGLIINGHPYEGYTGNAGELGYCLTTDQSQPPAPFQHPHLGAYFNLPQLYDLLREHSTDVSTPADLIVLYEQNNAVLLDWLDVAVQNLAPVILAIEYLIDPETIFFGGRFPDVLIRDLIKRVEDALPALRLGNKASFPNLVSATAGADAAALGVATLPMYASFAPVPRLLMKRNLEDGNHPSQLRDLGLSA